MKSTDKLTIEQVIAHAVGYARGNKCDLVIYDKPCCLDFMLKVTADKNGVKGHTVVYGKKEIIVKDEKGKIIQRHNTVLEEPQKKAKAKEKPQAIEDSEE